VGGEGEGKTSPTEKAHGGGKEKVKRKGERITWGEKTFRNRLSPYKHLKEKREKKNNIAEFPPRRKNETKTRDKESKCRG